MKTRMLFVLFAFIVFLGCKKKPSENIKDETLKSTNIENHEKKESTSSEEIKTCDDFLDRYEEWMDNYIKWLEGYKKDPVGFATSPEYNSTVLEGVDWMMQWGEKHADCAYNEKYAKRMKIIQEKGEKKLRDLGLK